jgi:two-component system, NtrC family, response regulator AtoC
MFEEKISVLVLDDEKNIVTVLKAILEKRDFAVDAFTDPREALDTLRRKKYDAAITDLYMPEIDGMAFLEEVKRLYPNLPVVMITAFGTVDSAVDAIKRGAFDYVTKPFEQSEIVSVVQKAANTSRLKKFSLDRPDGSNANSILLAGKGLKTVWENLRKVAPTPSVVCIYGESGSGKEFLAEEIHHLSDRSFQPMIKVNCAAVSSMGLEGELFGSQKPGRFELAHKGTLFLDEISEINSEVQQRLLDFLEGGIVENPLTGEKRKFDVRLIVASRKDLSKEVKEGKFREDLFYKLNVAPFRLPALRDRKDDLPEIISFLMEKLNHKLNRRFQSLSRSCLDAFQNFSWPGNLRQLENVLERMMLLSDGTEIQGGEILDQLKIELENTQSLEGGNSFREIVRRQTQNLEKDLIEKALDEMDGNITRTAEYLGISRKGLQLKMRELGIRS